MKPNKMNDFEYGLYPWAFCYKYWIDRLYNMSYTAIKWEGLLLHDVPTTIQLPEKFLVDKGMCAIFEDELLGFLCLPCVGEGDLNAYGEPSSYQAYGNNGYVRTGLIPNKNCVVIINNPNKSPEHENIAMFANRLTNSMITGDINLSSHKKPIIIVAPEELRLSAENIIAEYTAGVPVIKGNTNLADIDIKTLSLHHDFTVDKISAYTASIWNEWLNYLGVPGQIIQKRERMLHDEVAQTMGGSLASRVPRNATREQAVENLSNMFGWDVSFSYAIDSIEVPDFIKESGDRNENDKDII